MPTFDAVVAAPGFCLGVRCAGAAIAAIVFLEPCAEIVPESPLAGEAMRQLRAWLSDPSHRFSLPLAPAGTSFQRRVWAGIAAIPPGGIQTYGALAKVLGSGPRAVGNACGANPWPLIVPCHRVVAAGGIGGFNGNYGGFLLDVKRWLLDHERAD